MKRIMKSKVVATAVVVITTLVCTLKAPGPGYAFTGFEPGISDTKQYQEIVFLSGSPEVFLGTVKETTKTRGDTEQVSLTYKLSEPGGTGKLTRTVKLTSRIEKQGNQEKYVTSLDNYTETLDTGGQKFKVQKDGVFFNSSKVIDHQPAIDFTTGNWYIKRVYDAGKGKNPVVLEVSGRSEGYSNGWGSGETRTLEVKIKEQLPGGTTGWWGSAHVAMNDTSSRTLNYEPSRPELVSFTGGYIDETRRSQDLTVDYDMPTPVSGGLDNNIRNRGTYSPPTAAPPPEQKRLFIKEFKDLRGHWAREAIESQCGLGAYTTDGNYFSPGLPSRRGEFIKALMVVAGLNPDAPTQTTTAQSQRSRAPAEQPLFYDVDATNPYFGYIQLAGKRGIVDSGEKFFRPNANLTRAEAVTLLVKAMGLENLAPAPVYSTPFYDDNQIPAWARDAVYVAQKYNIISGNFTGGTMLFRPNDIVTRAEAAAMLDRFRDFLSQDFRKDYRDRLYKYLS